MNQARLAEAAERLLNDDTFKYVIAELKNEAVESWTRTNPDDVDGREELYYLYLAILHIENRLKTKSDYVKFNKENKPIEGINV